MTETERIRWEDKEPGNGDVYNVASIGCAGTAEEAAFIIYTPDELHANWLLSVRLIPGSTFLYADDPDELKAEAERWLAEFVASLGAVFPEDAYEFPCCEHDLEMAYAPGAYVRYAHPDAGWPGEQDEARNLLTHGRLYRVAWNDIGQSKTRIGLAGVKGAFNSVLFEPVDGEDVTDEEAADEEAAEVARRTATPAATAADPEE